MQTESAGTGGSFESIAKKKNEYVECQLDNYVMHLR